ncbi:tRNA modification GTPase [Tamlana sedimentorum]|uniref:tRNA modification GTPase n=1 Tax=Neotamlana sedimentorum TaxID=1435349 RepID=A0A0D7VX24_9FLAO|nr:PorT family protein [Tamlana sedimentorum]KJD31329.1 tRNA modification GTPase [Tamlana sedimentorum]
MKTQILCLLITILGLNCYSQISFEKGYYIDNTNQKVNCLIKNVDWKNNPTKFEYKLSENSEPKKATIKSIKEFGINNISKYVRSTVNIDRSSENINKLSTDKNPIFKEEQLFLKVLVDGKATLYQYADSNLKRYFYNKDNSDIEQLIFKSYKTADNNVAKNNRFKQQLFIDLNCANFKSRKIENLEYKKNSLVRFFTDYSNCHNYDITKFEPKEKRDWFNLTLRPRINSSSLSMQDPNSENIDFENKIGVGFGLETEFILPFNKNKWAIGIEPTYQSYKSEKTTSSSNFSGGVLIANVDYSSIEVPLSLRHYFFLNNNSKIFINASYVLDLFSKSSIELTRSDGSSVNSLEINSRNNLALGIGYKHNDRYSVEIRYQTNREIIGNYLYWNSEYKTLSLIFGYSLF